MASVWKPAKVCHDFNNDFTLFYSNSSFINKKYHAYQAGHIIYMYQAKGAIMHTGSRKIACYYVRPLVIYKAIGQNQFLLMSVDGVVYPHLVEETRLKPGVLWTTKGNVYTLTQLRQVLRTGVAAQGS